MSQEENYPQALPNGSVLAGQYTIEGVLGQGGFGITYCATDYKEKKKVAIKEFFPDTLAYREKTQVISYPGDRTENYSYGKDGFLDEAKTLSEFIGCDGVVRIYSYFEENNTAYFVMEYIDGVSFDNYLKEKGGKISCDEAEKILVPVMESLAIVHSKGIVHRDVTPDNIYITKDGKVKLLDFGAARYSLGDKSRSLDVILKHGFAPKEQYTRRGRQGPFTDVYSLGATFYFAITGRRPPDSIDRLDEDELIPPSSLGVSLTEYQETAILKALEVQPANRYQSMIEFRNALLNDPTFKLPEASKTVQQTFFTESASSDNAAKAENPAPAVMQTKQKIENPSENENGNTASVLKQENVKSDEEAVAEAVIHNHTSNTKVIVTIIVVAVIAAIIGIIAVNLSNNVVGTGNPVLINTNTFGNIQNGGICAYVAGKNYYVDELHYIRCSDSNSSILLESKNKSYSNLIYDYDDGLYYICNGKIYLYDFDEEKEKAVSKLKKYKGSDLQMYLSNDYYFVYNDGYLHRIQRETGKKEQSKYVGSASSFALCGNYLYYISDSKNICRVSALDFNSNESHFLNHDSSHTTDEYLMITSDGEKIGVLSICSCDSTQNKYHITICSESAVVIETEQDFEKCFDIDGSDIIFSDFNMLDNQFAVNVSDGNDICELCVGYYWFENGKKNNTIYYNYEGKKNAKYSYFCYDSSTNSGYRIYYLKRDENYKSCYFYY